MIRIESGNFPLRCARGRLSVDEQHREPAGWRRPAQSWIRFPSSEARSPDMQRPRSECCRTCGASDDGVTGAALRPSGGAYPKQAGCYSFGSMTAPRFEYGRDAGDRAGATYRTSTKLSRTTACVRCSPSNRRTAGHGCCDSDECTLAYRHAMTDALTFSPTWKNRGKGNCHGRE